MQRAHLLELNPGGPGGGETALGPAGVDDLLRSGAHLVPGGVVGVRVEAGFCEQVTVDPHAGGGAVERHRHHPAVRQAEVTLDGGDVDVRVEGDTGLFEQFVHRLDGRAGCHHRAGNDFEHLHDVRGVAGARSCDGGHHGVGVAAHERRVDNVIVLRVVEVLDVTLEQVTQRGGQAVPEVDLDLSQRTAGQHAGGCQADSCLTCTREHSFHRVCHEHHSFSYCRTQPGLFRSVALYSVYCQLNISMP